MDTMELTQLIDRWNTVLDPEQGLTVRVPEATLDDIDLSEDAKTFLRLGGLSDQRYMGTQDLKLSKLPSIVSQVISLPSEFNRYRVLGEIGYYEYHCLNEEADGELVAITINFDQPIEIIFVNSSIIHFAKCEIARLEFWHDNVDNPVLQSEDQFQENVSLYEQQLREIDSRALTTDQTHWAQTLEGLRNGLGF